MGWISYLKKSSRLKDKLLFNRWEKLEIGIADVIEEFKNNNRIPNRIKIDEIEFEYWLNSLGWYKWK